MSSHADSDPPVPPLLLYSVWEDNTNEQKEDGEGFHDLIDYGPSDSIAYTAGHIANQHTVTRSEACQMMKRTKCAATAGKEAVGKVLGRKLEELSDADINGLENVLEKVRKKFVNLKTRVRYKNKHDRDYMSNDIFLSCSSYNELNVYSGLSEGPDNSLEENISNTEKKNASTQTVGYGGRKYKKCFEQSYHLPGAWLPSSPCLLPQRPKTGKYWSPAF